MNSFARRAAAIVLAAAMLASLCACGEIGFVPGQGGPSTTPVELTPPPASFEPSPLPALEEFSALDGSYSISMSNRWVRSDGSTEEMLTISNILGTEIAIVFQIRKSGIVTGTGVDEMRDTMEDSYGVTSADPVDGFDLPGLDNICAYRGKATALGSDYDGCFVYGESDYAIYAVTFFMTDMDDDKIDNFRTYCSTFKETAPEVEVSELSDTLRWINASYAVLTEINGWDYNVFGGLTANDANGEMVRVMLEEWWGVTDRQSAEDTLDWILTEGHRADFAEDMTYLESIGLSDVDDRVGYLAILTDSDEEMAEKYAEWYEMYENYGAGAIDAWDYCRALNLLGFYYIAGYCTEEEALDRSLEIAETLQPMFGSWDELVGSYLRGYEYWAEESSDERREIYEDLNSRAGGPYAVDYNTELTKTW